MHNLGILIKYEWKKLFQKKLVVITIAVIFSLIIASNFLFLLETITVDVTNSGTASPDDGNRITEKYTMTGSEMLDFSIADARKVNGRSLDGDLLAEIQQTPASNPFITDYGEARAFFRQMTYQNVTELDDMNTEGLYKIWRENIFQNYKDYFLTAKEITYWEKKVDSIETPLVYQYDLGWSSIFQQVLTNGVMLLLLIAICLAGIFTDEHKLGTDQMLLCTRNSRMVCYAKTLTGILFGIGCTLMLYGITLGFSFFFYGADGHLALLQQEIVTSPYPITLGSAFLIVFGITILAAVLESVFALFLSEWLNNSLGAMSILVGIMLLTQFMNIPEKHRVLSQLWNYLPTNLITNWGFGDVRLVTLFGIYLNNFQVAAILYPLLSVLFILLTKKIYHGYQVTGR